jgi:PDZ domain-containing protein
MVVAPGSPMEITSLLNIPPEYREEAGQLYLTGVEMESASLFDWLVAQFSSDRETRPKGAVLPQDISEEAYEEMLRHLVEESTRVAIAVALGEAGHQVHIRQRGARVEDVLPQSPSLGKLRAGDIIVEMDGTKIEDITELMNLVQGKQVGEPVSLTLIRRDATIKVETKTMGSSAEPGQAALGIIVSNHVTEIIDLPFPVEIDTTYVVGPSVGLMFALAIYDGITPGDLTRGHVIAGTGTLSISGEVGPVGEVRLKALSAQRHGAEFFLFPRANYKDLEQEAFGKMQPVPVESFAEAKEFLSALD